MIFRLAFKNVITRKSSFIIVLFISFAVCLLSVANAVFDSTEHGIQESFISSFTGDIVVRPKCQTPLSLFGDETPFTGEMTKIPLITPYDDIKSIVSSYGPFVNQITGQAAVESSAGRFATSVFGLDSSFLELMPAVHIIDGVPYNKGDKAIMLSKNNASKLNVKVGDEVQFIVSEGMSFRIRACKVSAILEYDTPNDIFDRFIIVEPNALRSLLDMYDTITKDVFIDETESNLLDEDLDMDAIFNDVVDTEAIMEAETVSSDTEIPPTFEMEENNIQEQNQILLGSSSWNFFIIKIKNPKETSKTIRALNKTFKQKSYNVEAVNWRWAAGSSAMYLYWMRRILNVGIIIILVAGFIIVNNTLVINVLDRTREIGTMRAIGAGRLFVALQCMIETFIMCFASGIFGTLLSYVSTNIINKAHIVFSNDFLCQLFGSDSLSIFITKSNLLGILMLVIILGIAGWIYPVITTLKVSPVKAMQGAK